MVELRFRVRLEADFDRVRTALQGPAERWLPGSRQADGTFLVRLRAGEPPLGLKREARVSVAPAQLFGWGLVVPLEWRAAAHPGLFPVLLGYLRAEPALEGGTRLRFDARYTPPGGGVGNAADRAVLHRLARTTVDKFFAEVTTGLRDAAGGGDA
ncbi:MAG: hypothetical protein ACP5PW_06130 [Candidatus Dormibacteria bacterium]